MADYDKKEINVYITGDTHGFYDLGKLYPHNFGEGYQMKEGDILIITGDTNIVWDKAKDQEIIKWFTEKPWTTAYVPGNHENYLALKEYPIVDFHGAKSYKISDSVYCILRGEIMILKDKKYFCFGGAFSQDVQWRIEGISWFKEELPTQKEIDNAIKNLEKYNYEVDYIVTHDINSSCNQKMNYHQLDKYIMDKYRGEGENELYVNICDFLQQIYEKVNYKAWFAGHYHEDKKLSGVKKDEKGNRMEAPDIQILFNNIVKITDENEQGYEFVETPVYKIMNRADYTREELKQCFDTEGLLSNGWALGTYKEFGVMAGRLRKASEVLDYVEDDELKMWSEAYKKYCVRRYVRGFYK